MGTCVSGDDLGEDAACTSLQTVDARWNICQTYQLFTINHNVSSRPVYGAENYFWKIILTKHNNLKIWHGMQMNPSMMSSVGDHVRYVRHCIDCPPMSYYARAFTGIKCIWRHKIYPNRISSYKSQLFRALSAVMLSQSLEK